MTKRKKLTELDQAFRLKGADPVEHDAFVHLVMLAIERVPGHRWDPERSTETKK